MSKNSNALLVKSDSTKAGGEDNEKVKGLKKKVLWNDRNKI